MADSKNAAADTVALQHEVIGIGGAKTKEAFVKTKHPDALWFGQAGLGLFLHWGISSVHGGIDLSWGMIADKPWDKTGHVSPQDYYALAERFRPDSFQPEKWLQAAREAGFRYAVLTTKHHDGYTLWPSAYTDLGVQKYLPGIDLVGIFVEACRKCDLKVGLYYSPPDWHLNRNFMSFRYGSDNTGATPEKKPYDFRHKEITSVQAKPAGWGEYYHMYIRGQTLELLTRYGKIDLLWFDGGDYPAITVEEIRQLQPHILINPRMHGQGDFLTPECRMPESRPEGWWELCDTWGCGSWGYTKKYEDFRPNSWMLSDFTKVRGWGGNFLVNVAPRPDGTQPESYYQRMREVAEWMQRNGEAVFDVEPGPYPAEVNVPATIRGDTWYLLAPAGFENPISISATGEPIDAKMLASGRKIGISRQAGSITIAIPASERKGLVDVVKIRWKK
jgi:alpha-L-fucosidase